MEQLLKRPSNGLPKLYRENSEYIEKIIPKAVVSPEDIKTICFR